MGNFLDILSGRIFRFRHATGQDINAGSSDKLIVTPKALAESNAFSNIGISLMLPAVLSSKTSTLVPSTQLLLIPTNGYFFVGRASKIQAQLFALVRADAGCTGEICLMDALTNTTVPDTSFSFTNNTWSCVNGELMELEAGKTYALALRRLSGSGSKTVQVKAATLTLKLLGNG